MTLFAGGESITRHVVSTTVDGFGDDVPATTTDTVIDGVLVAPQIVGEVTELGRQGVPGNLTIYCPPATTLNALDRVTVRGLLYEVDGVAASWRSPSRGETVGVVADLKRMEG